MLEVADNAVGDTWLLHNLHHIAHCTIPVICTTAHHPKAVWIFSEWHCITYRQVVESFSHFCSTVCDWKCYLSTMQAHNTKGITQYSRLPPTAERLPNHKGRLVSVGIKSPFLFKWLNLYLRMSTSLTINDIMLNTDNVVIHIYFFIYLLL